MRWLVLLVVASLGCRPRAEESPSAVVQAAPSVTAVQAAPTITAEKVDGWLRYHRALAERSKDVADVKRVALIEQQARREVGLTEAELDLLEDCVSAVVSQRTIAKLTGAEAVRDFDKVTLGLKAEQRQKIEAAFGDVRAKAVHASSLEAERATFGDSAVTAVLAREAEVTATWNALLEAREPKPKVNP